MPVGETIRKALLVSQLVSSVLVILSHGQERNFEWASWATSGFLALWAAQSLPLLAIHWAYLCRSLPYAVIFPLKVWWIIVATMNLHDAGKIAVILPISIFLGLACLPALQVEDGTDISPDTNSSSKV